MGYIERKKLYKELETIRKRPLITYVTSIRPGCSAQMAQDVLQLFIKQIKSMNESDSIDFLLFHGELFLCLEKNFQKYQF